VRGWRFCRLVFGDNGVEVTGLVELGAAEEGDSATGCSEVSFCGTKSVCFMMSRPKKSVLSAGSTAGRASLLIPFHRVRPKRVRRRATKRRRARIEEEYL